MGRVKGSLLEGIRGKVGNLVFYEYNGETYVRKAPGKQSKSVKAKTSLLKRQSQSVIKQTHTFLKYFTHLLRFGYQDLEVGGRKPYHAAVSYTSKNCFRFVEKGNPQKVLDISLVKFSQGSLLGPQNAVASREGGGIQFTWRNNAWEVNAKPTDQAFVILIHEDREKSRWEFLGSFREKESHFLEVPFLSESEKWHAYLSFSQENPWTKKRAFSDSVYLGEV